MAADRETYRGDLSGVPEDLHGPLSIASKMLV